LRRGDWSSLALLCQGIVVVPTVGAVKGGGGRAVREGPEVASLWAGGVLGSVGRTSMMKRKVGTGGVLLGASGKDVSQSVAVCALGVAVSLPRCLNLEPLGEEEECGEEDGNIVGVNGDDYGSGLLREPNSSALVKVPSRPNPDLL